MTKKSKYVMVDPEPVYEKQEEASQFEIAEALNWYGRNKDEKDAAKILGCDLKRAKNNLTYTWTIRMRNQGYVFSEKTEEIISDLKAKFDFNTHSIPVDIDAEGNVIVNTTVNVQERIANKTDHHIGELEGMIDEYGIGEKPFNAYDWFITNDVKPIHANKIIEYFKARAKQFVKEVEDKKTREGYSSLGKAKIKSILSVMASIIKDAERLSQNANKTRKPRKKKPVSFDKQVSKLKFLEKDNNFKIQSISPVTIVGSDQLWVFNVKSRRLGVYIAADSAGLIVKGTTITNFSEKSISKTLRKPEKILSTVLDGGKIALRKVMDSINSKAIPLNGRINKDTVLLRVVKP